MNELKEKAKELLQNGTVKVIIGFAQGTIPNRTKPFIVRSVEDAEKLVFNKYCVNNLAMYLTRKEFKRNGVVGIVAKGCDVKAIVQLIQENQVKKDDVYIIGMNCSGVVSELGEEFNESTVATKCLHCMVHTPHLHHTLLGSLEETPKREDKNFVLMQKIDSMTAEERFDFWEAEFERCVKCYACRQACPMCYCEKCIADKSIPRWIESSAHTRGNFAWNMIRAFHLAGRCVGCNECERACPAEIPLSLLNRKMGMTANKEFDYIPGMNLNTPTLVGTYDVNDREDFIK
ncbi:MAG: heterodisulfide reductase subunit [Ignavibacteria bacterium]|nr:MAG: heterodisulfide reductase subunit [Ignavibacteria bacterium]KAF0160463.1 MAG: heterodisulfide reductase subunit [Ignavibacteria bacterium]